MALTNADIVNGVGLGPSWPPFNLPVRQPRGLLSALQLAFAVDTALLPNPSKLMEGAYSPLTTPVWARSGVGAASQHVSEFVVPAYFGPPLPSQSLWWLEAIHESNWHYPLSEPVWLSFKRSIREGSQQAFTAPSRLLPPVNVTVVMAATETETDVAQIAINVYTPNPSAPDLSGAKVSVVEESVSGGDPVSIQTS